MIITRRQFLVSAAAGAIVLPLVADELLHPGRKIFLPPRKVFTGDTAVRVARLNAHLVEHSYIGRDGRLHKSQFVCKDFDRLAAGMVQGVAGETLGPRPIGMPLWIENLNMTSADTMVALPVAKEKLVKLC
jgi:hypothetical protein